MCQAQHMFDLSVGTLLWRSEKGNARLPLYCRVRLRSDDAFCSNCECLFCAASRPELKRKWVSLSRTHAGRLLSRPTTPWGVEPRSGSPAATLSHAVCFSMWWQAGPLQVTKRPCLRHSDWKPLELTSSSSQVVWEAMAVAVPSLPAPTAAGKPDRGP